MNCNAYSEPMTSHALGGLAAAGGRCVICSNERRADIITAILKVRRHIKNPIPSVDTHYWKNNSDKFHSDRI